MHEAGLARAVAATLRERDLTVGAVRLLVRGGHHEAAAFDAALRAHLSALLPGTEADDAEIVHVAIEQLCVGCGRLFEAPAPEAVCPACGASALPSLLEEQVEIELR